MNSGNSLTTACVLEIFSQEIARHGGRVSDTFDDGHRLFVRSVLPQIEEVRSNDRLQGGVALKACGAEIWIHPYVFRLVCRNGAIMAQAVESRRLTALFEYLPDQTVSDLREAINACCAPEVFTFALGKIRSARDAEVDFALNVMPLLARLPVSIRANVAQQIMKRFFNDGDRTRLGLMNAATSLARDTQDPETRWNLEELGGGIPVGDVGRIPRTPGRREGSPCRVEFFCC